MSISSPSSLKQRFGISPSSSLCQQPPSRVLLVCVYDTLVFELTTPIILQKFRPFGPVTRLLVFERGEVTKFFLEYAQTEQAIKAREELDGTKLMQSIGKMGIYFSSLASVDLRSPNSEGEDFSSASSFEEEIRRQSFLREYDLLTKSSPDSDADCFNDLLLQSFTAFSPFSRSKTDNPVSLARQIAEVDLSAQDRIGEENEFDSQIKSNIESILDSNSNSSHGRRQKVENERSPSQTFLQAYSPTDSPVKLKENLAVEGSILRFEAPQNIEIRHVYNLFSNFGNVAGVSRKKHSICVKFRTPEFAALALAYLNGFSLMGTPLALLPARYEDFSPRQNEFCELVFFDPSTYDRFTPTKSITVNAPSQTLHVSSLKRQICRERVLKGIFEQCGVVEAVQILKGVGDRNMALVQMGSMEESFRAVAELHNGVFAGRKMQISFTKSRV